MHRLKKVGHTTEVVIFPGVNGTPLFRGIEFTHAPFEAGERLAEMRQKGKLETFDKAIILELTYSLEGTKTE